MDIHDVLTSGDLIVALKEQRDRHNAIAGRDIALVDKVDLADAFQAIAIHVNAPVKDLERIAAAYALIHCDSLDDATQLSAVRDTFLQAFELGHLFATVQKREK